MKGILRHLTVGNISAILTALVGLFVALYPKFQGQQQQITATLVGAATSLLGVIQMVDEIAANIREQYRPPAPPPPNPKGA